MINFYNIRFQNKIIAFSLLIISILILIIGCDLGEKSDKTSVVSSVTGSQQETQQALVKGKIIDDSYFPIPDAKVSFWKGETFVADTQTNNLGEFAISLPAGLYKLRVAKDGYNSKIQNINVEKGTNVIAKIKIQKISSLNVSTKSLAKLDLRIVDNVENPVKNALINITSQNNPNLIFDAITNNLGEVSFSLPPSTYTIKIVKSGFSTTKTAITLLDGEYKNLIFRLECVAKILGIVKDEQTNSAISGIRVDLYAKNNNLLNYTSTTSTTSSGEFIFENVISGEYIIVIGNPAPNENQKYQISSYTVVVLRDGTIIPKQIELLARSLTTP